MKDALVWSKLEYDEWVRRQGRGEASRLESYPAR